GIGQHRPHDLTSPLHLLIGDRGRGTALVGYAGGDTAACGCLTGASAKPISPTPGVAPGWATTTSTDPLRGRRDERRPLNLNTPLHGHRSAANRSRPHLHERPTQERDRHAW